MTDSSMMGQVRQIAIMLSRPSALSRASLRLCGANKRQELGRESFRGSSAEDMAPEWGHKGKLRFCPLKYAESLVPEDAKPSRLKEGYY